ncbi:MAG: site-specific integrase [Candidatus Glassbacteria bacterium]|nr:site-specific integrase [Candidatus Glassbacteria bacterium]
MEQVNVFATELTDAGAVIRDVQALLDHSSVTMTERYAAPARGARVLKLQRRVG